jgi:hypothetical protein
MARKQLDGCMFCAPDPCECKGPKPKTQPSKKSVSSEDLRGNVRLPTVDVPVAPARGQTVDLKAAMRKASESQTDGNNEALYAMKTRWVRKSELKVEPKPEDDPEFVAALAVLEPILHSQEKRRWRIVLEKAGTRAQRWRRRRDTV